VKAAAQELGLPVETPERCRAPEFVERVRELRCDALVVASYGQILSEALLSAAVRGGINLHGSLLPKLRGAAPIQRAILEGESETGVTLMQMDRGMDTGDVIAASATPIGADENYSQLQSRLAEIGADLAGEWMPRIAKGRYTRTPQDDASATLAPKVTKSEAELSFERPASDEYRRFRAFTDSPGAFVRTRHGSIRISEARSGEGAGTPGTVLSVAPALTVAFASGSMEWRVVQPEGKKRMTGRDFANGMRIRPGDTLLP
jgi:methionyl-tRNA formyltransferase